MLIDLLRYGCLMEDRSNIHIKINTQREFNSAISKVRKTKELEINPFLVPIILRLHKIGLCNRNVDQNNDR